MTPGRWMIERAEDSMGSGFCRTSLLRLPILPRPPRSFHFSYSLLLALFVRIVPDIHSMRVMIRADVFSNRSSLRAGRGHTNCQKGGIR